MIPHNPAGLLATLAQSSSPAAPGWRPFLDPLPVHVFTYWWLLLLPMALLIALGYKATRMKNIKGLGVATVTMAFQIVVGMVALAAASWLLVEWFVPMVRG
jgi:hypothetical protein